jgi:hypothetical protein
MTGSVQACLRDDWQFASDRLATDNLFSPNFGQGVAFVDPRRAMVSARVNLGR